MRRTNTMAVALGIATAFALPSLASARDDDITRAGTCPAGITSELELSEEDGRIEVEFEVDQNRTGVRWQVVITRNGTRVFSGQRVTRGRSGSFTVHRLISDARGRDRVVARATSRSGQVCRATATY